MSAALDLADDDVQFVVVQRDALLARAEAMQRLIDELMDHEELRPYLENTEGVWRRLCDEYDANGTAIALVPKEPTNASR